MLVFVSSTSEDLKPQRSAVRDIILSLGWQPSMMEQFLTRPNGTVSECLLELAKSHLVVSLIAFRRGWVPTTDQGGDGLRSITALELEQAQVLRIPTLFFLADP